MVAEWAYERPQIKLVETHRSHVRIRLGTLMDPLYMLLDCDMMQWYPW